MLKDRLANRKRLEKCWKEIYQGKSDTVRRMSCGIDEITLNDFKREHKRNIEQLSIALKNNEFQFSPLKGFPKSKGKKKKGVNKKKRLISVPTVQDRIVHKAILSVLNDVLYTHINTGVSYCGVKKSFWTSISLKNEIKMNIRKAIKVLVEYVEKGYFWIFETDIKGFFDNVPKDKMIEKVFAALPKGDNSLNEYIKQIIYFEIDNLDELKNKNVNLPEENIGLAQGSSLSPIFANLYLAKFDICMKSKFGTRYIRYVDDFVVLCKSEKEAIEAKGFSEGFLLAEGLKIAPDKTDRVFLKQKERNIVFLGIKISMCGLFPKKKLSERKMWLATVLRLKDYKIQYSKTTGKKRTKIMQMNDRIQGWGYFYRYYHVNSYYKEMDIRLKQLTNDKGIRGIKSLSKIPLRPIISLKKWCSIFE